MEIQGLTPGDIPANSQWFVLIIIAFILLLQLRERRVRWWSLMIMPVVMFLITITVVGLEINSGFFNLAIILVGFAIGIAIGVVIGSRMEVKVDDKGRMLLKGSTIAVLLWMAIIVVKIYGKGLLSSFGLIDIDVITSAFLVMTLGSMTARRAYIYWQFRIKKQDMASVGVKTN